METSGINWGKLVHQNRVKAPGIGWTDEERKAIESGVSPDDVRAGILSKEEVEKEDKEADPAKKLARMKKEELIKMAKDLGIKIDEKATTRETLLIEIQKVQEKVPEPVEEK